MKKFMMLMAMAIFAGATSATVIWSEDFEDATIGATNPHANGLIPDTDVYAKNSTTTGGDYVVAATPAGFTDNISSQALEIHASPNNYQSLTPGSNGATVSFDAISVDSIFTFSYDLYLVTDVTVDNGGLGGLNHRWSSEGTVGTKVDQGDTVGGGDNVAEAGIYHIELTGTIADFTDRTGTVDGFASFLYIKEKDENLADGTLLGYIDNINLSVVESVPEPATLGLLGIFGSAILAYRRRRA